MSGFKITEPDGSVYDHGNSVHLKKAHLIEAHKVACEELAKAQAQFEAATAKITQHALNFVGHHQAFQQKAQVLRKKQQNSHTNLQQKKHALAELECTLEPSVRQQIAKFSNAATSTAASSVTSASTMTVADFTLAARMLLSEK